ncbi:MAG: sigma-54 dependent transcriptional regulator [Prevotellaceae bacterium]|jgi:transcriptional regulator with PAS, ATPase and Fis domain|nr:sigma-54 dependent transcriptional regulator [Prevotellaceae bacterium]
MDIQSVKQRFDIVGNSAGLNRALDIACQVAPTDLSVLITGESGTGKESFPKVIHAYSARKHGQYIAVNCGAIPEGTIDSELFGHEKGSFTGAHETRKGYFEVADGGTIFLDEVAELPIATQARLLRVLESGEFIKVGSSKVQKTNVRIIAATNVDLSQLIQNGRFREDLYYRLNTIPIQIPPLRERKDDIYLLFRKFASDFAEKYQMPVISLDAEARQLLESFYWPGNVRQLKNVTEQLSIIENERVVNAETLQRYLPDVSMQKLPALYTGTGKNDDGTFASERDILYKILFDMRNDMNDLKRIVHELTATSHINGKSAQYMGVDQPPYSGGVRGTKIVSPISIDPVDGNQSHITDTEEFVEESLSLQDQETELIRKALAKHNGKRKLAAEELGISERTLYRKIKEYNIK